MKSLELTLAILKPHLVKNPVSLACIRKRILDEQFLVVKSKRHTLTKNEAEKFYEDHKNKFFYNRLVTSMLSGPSDIYVLARENAVKHWRMLMGPTKVYKAIFESPHSLRAEFGLSDTRNATHGSDSPESTKKEIQILLPEFDVEDWYENQIINFNRDNIIFDKKLFMHLLKTKNIT